MALVLHCLAEKQEVKHTKRRKKDELKWYNLPFRRCLQPNIKSIVSLFWNPLLSNEFLKKKNRIQTEYKNCFTYFRWCYYNTFYWAVQVYYLIALLLID